MIKRVHSQDGCNHIWPDVILWQEPGSFTYKQTQHIVLVLLLFVPVYSRKPLGKRVMSYSCPCFSLGQYFTVFCQAGGGGEQGNRVGEEICDLYCIRCQWMEWKESDGNREFQTSRVYFDHCVIFWMCMMDFEKSSVYLIMWWSIFYCKMWCKPSQLCD